MGTVLSQFSSLVTRHDMRHSNCVRQGLRRWRVLPTNPNWVFGITSPPPKQRSGTPFSEKEAHQPGSGTRKVEPLLRFLRGNPSVLQMPDQEAEDVTEIKPGRIP